METCQDLPFRPNHVLKSTTVQVETIRDAYMVVAGVPNKTTFHAHHICDMALDMLSSIDHLKDPSTGDNIQIRVGERALPPSAALPAQQRGDGQIISDRGCV